MAESNASEILNAAQSLYLKAEYQSAIDIIRKGRDKLDPGLFHYNLGSLYLKKNDLGPARLHLEKAKKENFNFPMVYKNLEIVTNQPQVYDPIKSDDITEVATAKTLDIPFIFFLCFSLLVLSAGLFALRRKVLKNWLVKVVIIILAVSPPLIKIVATNTYKSAVALKSVRVFEGPSQVFTDFGEIGEGSRVIISEFKADWYYVISPKQIQGWVPKTDIAFY